MSILRVVIALAIFTGLLFLIHRYIWARLIRDPAWPTPWRRVLTVAVFALAAAIPLAFPAIRWWPRSVSSPLSWIAYTWMGLMLYLFLLTLVADAGRGAAALVGALSRGIPSAVVCWRVRSRAWWGPRPRWSGWAA